jgi:hypothetical protein
MGTTNFSAVAADTFTGNLVGSATGLETVSTLITTKTVTAAESGTTFFLNLAGGFTVTLPAPAAGLKYTFIVKTAPTTAYIIVSAASANIIKGLQISIAGDAGDTGTADDTITFVENQALPGDKVELISDGTSWFAVATTKIAAALTFTQAD